MNPIDEKTTEEKDFEEALLLVPEEVQDFMWSDAFEYILDTAEKVIPLSKDEKDSMRRAAYDLLINLSDIETTGERLVSGGIDKEKVVKILYIIDTEILAAAKNIMEYEDDITNQISKLNEGSAPSPMQALASIQERLTKSSTVAPITRDYSVTRATEVAQKTDSAPKAPSMDIYREIPEE
jgi:hypothetical protein